MNLCTGDVLFSISSNTMEISVYTYGIILRNITILYYVILMFSLRNKLIQCRSDLCATERNEYFWVLGGVLSDKLAELFPMIHYKI